MTLNDLERQNVQFGVVLVLCRGSLSYRRMSYRRIPLRSSILVGCRLVWSPRWVLVLKVPRSWIVLIAAYWFWLPLSCGDILRRRRLELSLLSESKRRLRSMDVHRYLYGFWPFPEYTS